MNMGATNIGESNIMREVTIIILDSASHAAAAKPAIN